MPKSTMRRVATADKIATLLRVYRAATKSGDTELQQAAFAELRTRYGVDLALVEQAISETESAKKGVGDANTP